MNRVTVFAHYSDKNVIEDYVIYYIEALKKISSKIIFVSDSNLSSDELKKINPFVCKTIATKHGEYDFGSYKRGFLYAKNENLLNDCDELIFTNDSCYAPMYPFEEMINEMSKQDTDFWGATCNNMGIKITQNNKIKPTDVFHIQSYFLLFKPIIFNSELFNSFIASIKKEENKYYVIINYEIGLTKMLMQNGFKSGYYAKNSYKYTNSHLEKFEKLLKEDRLPFLKRSIFLNKNIDIIFPVPSIKKLLKDNEYDYRIIEKDIDRNKEKIKFSLVIKKIIRELKARYTFNSKNLRRKIIRFSLKHRTLTLFEKEYKF